MSNPVNLTTRLDQIEALQVSQTDRVIEALTATNTSLTAIASSLSELNTKQQTANDTLNLISQQYQAIAGLIDNNFQWLTSNQYFRLETIQEVLDLIRLRVIDNGELITQARVSLRDGLDDLLSYFTGTLGQAGGGLTLYNLIDAIYIAMQQEYGSTTPAQVGSYQYNMLTLLNCICSGVQAIEDDVKTIAGDDGEEPSSTVTYFTSEVCPDGDGNETYTYISCNDCVSGFGEYEGLIMNLSTGNWLVCLTSIGTVPQLYETVRFISGEQANWPVMNDGYLEVNVPSGNNVQLQFLGSRTGISYASSYEMEARSYTPDTGS